MTSSFKSRLIESKKVFSTNNQLTREARHHRALGLGGQGRGLLPVGVQQVQALGGVAGGGGGEAGRALGGSWGDTFHVVLGV